MKLYGGIGHRRFKSFAGGKKGIEWLKLGLTIKPGDLVHTCRGYNEVVEDIEIETMDLRGGWIIIDLTIVTEGGANCSWRHCIDYPCPSRDQIMAYFKSFPDSDMPFGKRHNKIVAAIKEGKVPFDEKGQLLPEYKDSPA